jgi:glycosyltransferase involved in cell wall biosynthesis
MDWHPDSSGSGIGRMYHGLVHHLPETGMQVRGLVTGPDPLPAAPEHVAPFAQADASLTRRLKGLRTSARDVLRNDHVDVVASHFGLYTLPLIGLLDDRPLVVHFHGPWADESAVEGEPAWKVRCKKWLERTAYRQGDRFVVLSRAFRDTLADGYGIPRDLIRVVPGGVNTDRFEAELSLREAREQLAWPTDRPLLLTVRRLVRRTGVDRLIEAIDRVREFVPEILLYVGGTGPQRPALEAQIESRDLSDHVRLLGYLPEDDLPLAYRAADLSVVPSVAREGFGLVVVESLAAGTPALVTPVGGLPEVVSGLPRGLLLSDNTPGCMADRIREIVAGRVALPDAAACRAFTRARYDWSTVARQIGDVYEEVA